MNNYLDQYGLPGTQDYPGHLDMGDSAAIFFNVIALSDGLDASKTDLFMKDAPVRHPDDTKWWGKQDRFSRDQLIPVLCYGALKGSRRPIIGAVFRSHLKRLLLLAWNTRGNGAIDMPKKFPDVTGPEILGLWLRVYKPVGYKLLLPICDLETLVNALLWRYYQPTTNQITRNHMLVSITQRDVSPSIVSKLSYRINNFPDLVKRWQDHVNATGEYPVTADLFAQKLLGSKR